MTEGAPARIDRVLTTALNEAEKCSDPKDRMAALRIASDTVRWQAEKLPTMYAKREDAQAAIIAELANTIQELSKALGIDVSPHIKDLLPKVIEGTAERVVEPIDVTPEPAEEIDW